MDYYAYNPEAAEHEFYTAADLDPHMAMAFWGIAISNAPNLNVPATDDRAGQARRAIVKAKALESFASAEDRAMIDAAATRFTAPPSTDADAILVAYSETLQAIAKAYPDDPDAAALYAESALYVAAGHVRTQAASMTAPERATFLTKMNALLPLFQSALARFPKHAGLLHFYIHAAEMADNSEVAVEAARALAAFSFRPEDSHLTHMPGHTFFDVGMYDEAVDVGRRSVAMDFADFACCHPGYYSAPRYYHAHNVAFLLYGLTEAGHVNEAIAVAKREASAALIAQQFVAAQRWSDVLSLSIDRTKPDVIVTFARGLAYAKLGDAIRAQNELDALAQAAIPQQGPDATLEAQRLTLAAQIAELQGDDQRALRLLLAASSAAQSAGVLFRAEIAPMYYFSPHMALAQVAERLGNTSVERAALQAELAASPRSACALSALAKLDAK